MKVLVLDNFDSFVYNLVQYLGALGAEPVVVRSDVPVEDIVSMDPDAVVISPGPGHPEDAGCSVEVIERLGSTTPVLGVCLGHQAIGVAFGATVAHAPELMHGKTSVIEHDGSGVFSGIVSGFEATRYHSLAVVEGTIPSELVVNARTPSGVIMGVRHRDLPVHGVQFHPESVLTEHGMQLVENFLKIV